MDRTPDCGQTRRPIRKAVLMLHTTLRVSCCKPDPSAPNSGCSSRPSAPRPCPLSSPSLLLPAPLLLLGSMRLLPHSKSPSQRARPLDGVIMAASMASASVPRVQKHASGAYSPRMRTAVKLRPSASSTRSQVLSECNSVRVRPCRGRCCTQCSAAPGRRVRQSP